MAPEASFAMVPPLRRTSVTAIEAKPQRAGQGATREGRRRLARAASALLTSNCNGERLSC